MKKIPLRLSEREFSRRIEQIHYRNMCTIALKRDQESVLATQWLLGRWLEEIDRLLKTKAARYLFFIKEAPVPELNDEIIFLAAGKYLEHQGAIPFEEFLPDCVVQAVLYFAACLSKEEVPHWSYVTKPSVFHLVADILHC